MPNHNAHTFFGMQALEELPPAARQKCTEDFPVFQTALYGPDPLIFCSVQAKQRSDYLHKTWRSQTLSKLERAVRMEEPALRSFAAGYLLHQMLDDAVHPYIYRRMEEGSVHMHLEVALDRLILDEQGIGKSPRLNTEGRERTIQAAASFITPATEEQYSAGLRRMTAVADLLRLREKTVLAKVTEEEWAQARVMRQLLEDAISSAAGMLDGLLE